MSSNSESSQLETAQSKTALSKTNSTQIFVEIFIFSFAALFLELAIIRWLSSEIRIFAYFKNLALMASFLGFGLGFYLHEKANKLFKYFPILLYILSFIIAGASRLGITYVIFADPRQYFLLGSGFGDHIANSAPQLFETLKALIVIVSIFFLVVALFASLTARLGALMNQVKPISGYSINVLGSLIGIIGFSVVSYFWLPPYIWIALAIIPLIYFYKNSYKGKDLIVPGLSLLITIGFAFFVNYSEPAIWSPYYRISIQKNSTHGKNSSYARGLDVNHDGFQAIQDLSENYLSQFPIKLQPLIKRHYNIPYNLSKRQIKSVLILGGGTGNDAAAALRNGAEYVDVVEIDPAILKIGKDLHPEKPYLSSKVHLYSDDARSFLNKTAKSNSKKYDLIVFATLDSHVVFSSLSSLRLDNFVFTEESFESAKRLLSSGGGLAFNFYESKQWLSQRHLDTVRKVMMGSQLLTYGSDQIQENLILAGNIFDPLKKFDNTVYKIKVPQFTDQAVEPITDNWPFLFLEKKGIPFHYLLPLLFILVFSLIPLRAVGLSANQINLHFFFMGAAFLLIETKSVTTLSLLLGSTWLVNSIVIGTILFMILFANLIIQFTEAKADSKVDLKLSNVLNYQILYAGLFASLLVNYFFPFQDLNSFDLIPKILISGSLIGLPIFFAALIFAQAFAKVEIPSIALASNLLGSLFGGMLEYLDMWTGLRFLNILALGLYIASYVFLIYGNRSKPSTEDNLTPINLDKSRESIKC
jgi:SAM-dependent methyltransferase